MSTYVKDINIINAIAKVTNATEENREERKAATKSFVETYKVIPFMSFVERNKAFGAFVKSQNSTLENTNLKSDILFNAKKGFEGTTEVGSFFDFEEYFKNKGITEDATKELKGLFKVKEGAVLKVYEGKHGLKNEVKSTMDKKGIAIFEVLKKEDSKEGMTFTARQINAFNTENGFQKPQKERNKGGNEGGSKSKKEIKPLKDFLGIEKDSINFIVESSLDMATTAFIEYIRQFMPALEIPKEDRKFEFGGTLSCDMTSEEFTEKLEEYLIEIEENATAWYERVTALKSKENEIAPSITEQVNTLVSTAFKMTWEQPLNVYELQLKNIINK